MPIFVDKSKILGKSLKKILSQIQLIFKSIDTTHKELEDKIHITNFAFFVNITK